MMLQHVVDELLGANKAKSLLKATRQLMFAESTHVSTIFLAKGNLLHEDDQYR
jgi:hypothetical protein